MASKHPVEKLVESQQEHLKSVYRAFIDNSNSYEAISKIIKILQLNSSASLDKAELFQVFWKVHSKSQTFFDFLSIISGWVIECNLQSITSQILQSTYLSHLKSLTKYYNKILPSLSPADSSVIKSAFNEIKFYFQHYSKTYQKVPPKLCFRSSILLQEQQGITQLFHFFAVQHLFLGKFPTFVKVLEEKESWDMGTFLIFCKQFSIVTQNRKDKKRQKEKIVQIFRKNSSGTMAFWQFLHAIEELAVFFVEERRTGVLQGVKVEDEKVFFFERMKFADLGYLKMKMKPFKQVFGPDERHIRKASVGYKFNVSESVGKKLKVFKEVKKQAQEERYGSQGRIEKKSLRRVASAMRIEKIERVRVYSERCFRALR